MRTPPEILKSVVFLGDVAGQVPNETPALRGTAFIVCVQEQSRSYLYLVTARHSVLALSGKRAVVRANTHSGGYKRIDIDDKWWFHPTEEKCVDVAVRPFPPNELDVVPIPLSMFLGDKEIYEYYVGPGDDVVITGLFTRMVGESANVPILRRGSVAMFPDQKIISASMGRGEDPQDIEGYLIEVRSVGGLSGSPAFVRASIGLDFDVHNRSGHRRMARVHVQGDYFLLGLAQGHWEIPPSQRNSIDVPHARRDEDSINLGIAIVVPAKKIKEVIDHPDLVAMRQR